MILVTLVCLLKIRFNAWFTGVCLAIELIVVGALAVAGFTHWHQPLSIRYWTVSGAVPDTESEAAATGSTTEP